MGDFVLITFDGLRLFGYDWPSYDNAVSPRAVIILLHGLAEHIGRYDEFAHFYNENSIAVIAMDFRGHGSSEGIHTYITKSESLFKDIDCLVNEAQHRYPSSPFILYGHSMGGSLALSYTLNRYSQASKHCPYQALVITSPWIRLVQHLQPSRLFYSIIHTIARWYPSFKVPLRFDTRIISRDEHIVNAYNNDSCIRRTATLSLARTMGDMARTLDCTNCSFHIPVLIEHGDADALTSHRASQEFARRGSNIDYRCWPDCYHELHNEPERQQICAFTLQWIKNKLNIV
jgi:acylglycerol lipase